MSADRHVHRQSTIHTRGVGGLGLKRNKECLQHVCTTRMNLESTLWRESSRSGKTTCCSTPLVWAVQSRQKVDLPLSTAADLGRNGEWLLKTLFLWVCVCSKNVVILIVMVAQLREYNKNNWIIDEWLIRYVSCIRVRELRKDSGG